MGATAITAIVMLGVRWFETFKWRITVLEASLTFLRHHEEECQFSARFVYVDLLT